jgi:hypothetical protein
MKKETKKQQEQTSPKELSNDDLLNVTGGNEYCPMTTKEECEEEQHCVWVKGLFGHDCIDQH